MPDRFLPLEDFLRACDLAAQGPADIADSSEACIPIPEVVAPADGDTLAAIAQARLMRAAIEDVCIARIAQLTCDLAVAILGRELRLAPVDIRAVALATLEEARADEPLAVRVHPDEVAAVHGLGARVVADAALRCGDVVLDVRHGSIDARLGTRLDVLLAGYLAP